MTALSRVLLIGYGNPGRRDDGLGPALANRLKQLELPSVVIDEDYQLNVEHAWDIANYDVAIFADAAIDSEQPFYFRQLSPSTPTHFSTHSVPPQAVLHLGQELFQASCDAYLLGIRGYEFEQIAEGLTTEAAANLESAFAFIALRLQERNFCLL